jgi:oligoendopeptidase F
MTTRRLSLVLAAALTAVFLCVPALAEERSAVPDRYKWKTGDLYPSEDAWYRAKDEIAARVPQLTAFRGRLGESADALYTAFSTMSALRLDLERLLVYASMRQDEDLRVAGPREMSQAGQQLAVQVGAATSWVTPEILALGAEKVNAFVAADPRLAPYQPGLDDILRAAPHTLSAAEEKLASQTGMMSGSGGRVFGTFTNADFPCPEVTLSTGEKVRLDAAGYSRYRNLPDREDRKLVFRAYWSKAKEFERTLGTTLDAQVRARLFTKETRNYGSCLEAALFDANVPTSVYRQLITDVHANLPTLHRYLRLRQRMMGVDTLRYEDFYAPIVKAVNLRFTPEQAMEATLKAVAPLGPDYVAVLKSGFDSGWVDFMPTTGKRSGAYSTGVYGVHPYQLQNFTGLYEQVGTLAHEAGHSMHTYLADKAQPYPTHDYKIFVAEVPSTLNENLLLQYMLAQTKDRDTRLYLLGSALDNMRGTLFRQALFAEFELKFHELAEKGEPLTGEKLSALYLGLIKEYYGVAQGVCAIDDLYAIEWALVPHFYRGFYVYQYATSLTASAQISASMRAESTARKPTTRSRDAFLRMLSAGSTKYPIELLKDAGVDMTTSAPFTAAMNQMNGIMDEMEKLLAAKPRQ